MAGVVSCSIVIAHRRPDANCADLADLRDAPEAHGLISVSENAWPEATGSGDMRAVVSVEADNPDSVRWYAHEVLRLWESHPAWQDMKRQLRKVDNRPSVHDLVTGGVGTSARRSRPADETATGSWATRGDSGRHRSAGTSARQPTRVTGSGGFAWCAVPRASRAATAGPLGRA